jgi:tRNA A37 threonylcarbamoyladenosine synthetase subunit TsaC/SUA5/YrdC
MEVFGERLRLVIDGGPCSGQPSTVVDVTGGDPSTWRVIRQGSIEV